MGRDRSTGHPLVSLSFCVRGKAIQEALRIYAMDTDRLRHHGAGACDARGDDEKVQETIVV